MANLPEYRHLVKTVALLILCCISACGAQQPPQQIFNSTDSGTDGGAVTISFRPSVGVVLGIFAVMFLLTFVLLMYTKYCRGIVAANMSSSTDQYFHGHQLFQGAATSDVADRVHSGLDKRTIESLPFFRFSVLRGSRAGLDCAVCLSPFDDSDVLRLLPRCRHAFHIRCIDRWLDSHASCPLCRSRVSRSDGTSLMTVLASSSSRYLDVAEDSSASSPYGRDILELFIERQPDNDRALSASLRRASFRISGAIGSSFRKIINSSSKEKKAVHEQQQQQRQELLHRFNHRIVVSDAVFKSRWSELNSADFIKLNSDMIGSLSSRRFASLEPTLPGSSQSTSARFSMDCDFSRIKAVDHTKLLESNGDSTTSEEQAAGRTSSAEPSAEPSAAAAVLSGFRSASDIGNNFSRFREARRNTGAPMRPEDDNMQRLWLPIAHRTVQWFAGRENQQNKQHRSIDPLLDP